MRRTGEWPPDALTRDARWLPPLVRFVAFKPSEAVLLAAWQMVSHLGVTSADHRWMKMVNLGTPLQCRARARDVWAFSGSETSWENFGKLWNKTIEN